MMRMRAQPSEAREHLVFTHTGLLASILRFNLNEQLVFIRHLQCARHCSEHMPT